MTRCPVCESAETVETVRRARLPAMQNYVYRTRKSAVAAPQAQFVLTVCRSCEFAWNSAFDSSLLVYDAGYDNTVPSAVMEEYYREIAALLRDRYDLDDGLIVDVGCGNGAFLRAVCELAPTVRGLGVDPALDDTREELGGRMVLIKGAFSLDLIEEAPTLITSRHVLEHIAGPVEFLREIRSAVDDYGPCPCFFEVPDLGWILQNGAFWDFCYEHCNYFTDFSMAEALTLAGYEPIRTRTAFGAQYRWMEARTRSEQFRAMNSQVREGFAERALAYAASERDQIAAIQARLQQWKSEGSSVVVWGMATKGVLFSLLADPKGALIDHCIDVNVNKQGCFVPLTGHRISAPVVLRDESRPLIVLVMNDSYRSEIKKACSALAIEATIVSASTDL